MSAAAANDSPTPPLEHAITPTPPVPACSPGLQTRFCSHCQKERPISNFHGVNRNKGPRNEKIELLKTCENCRSKQGKVKRPFKTMNTRTPTSGGTAPHSNEAGISTHRSSARRTAPRESPMVPESEIAASRSSTGSVVGVNPPSPEPAAKRTRMADSSPRPPVGQEILAFANSLHGLSRLLVAAVEELDDEAVEGLQEEIHHDWRVEEMTTFVEGYYKGASKRNARKQGW